MARTRDPGYDDQRSSILASAAHLFAQRGFAGTSMNEVADACGVSKATLYHYVRDKNELLLRIAEGHVLQLQALVAEVEAEVAEPQARLRELIRRFVAEYAGAQDAHRVLTEDVRYLDAGDRERVLSREREVVAGFTRAVTALRPDLKAAALATPVTMLLFGMINWMFTWMKADGPVGHDRMAPLVADLFLGGLPAVSTQAQAPARAPVSGAPASKPKSKANA